MAGDVHDPGDHGGEPAGVVVFDLQQRRDDGGDVKRQR
jgi:hypothetical protein